MKLQKAVIKSLLMSSISITSLGYASVAIAQDAAEEEIDDSNIIIVTASKRETTLQELPISVSVTSAATIENAAIRDLQDLQSVAPSLRVNTLQNSANTNFIIRGFGNGANNAGIEPSVGVFIDGVYRSRSAAQIGDLDNIQRVEVLRGPQSTLFGKNASAGVISIVTQKPQFDFGGSAEVSYGNFNAVIAKAAITGPISDTLAFSLSGNYNNRDGYVDDLASGGDVNNRNRYGGRAQLLWEPTDNLSFRLIGDYDRIDEECCVAANLLAGPTVPAIFAVGGALDPEAPFSFNTFLNVLPSNRINNYGASLETEYSSGAFTFTNITSYRGVDRFLEQDVDFSSADIVNEIQDQEFRTFTTEFRVASDLDGPFNFLIGGFYFNEDIQQTSQLVTGQDTRTFFELLTPTGPGTFLGVEQALNLPFNSIFSPGLLTDEAFTLSNEAFSIFGTIDFEVTDRLTLTLGANYTDDSKQFGLGLNALDELGQINLVDAFITLATMGGVTTRDQFQGLPAAQQAGLLAAAQNPAVNPLIGLSAFQFQPPFLSVPNSVEDGRTSDKDLSYTIRASYEVSDAINVYATYATGFKASSVNLSRDSRPFPADFVPGPGRSTFAAPDSPIINAGLAVTNLTNGTRTAEPEEAEVYEVGIKGQWDGFAFNLALFDQTLTNFQSNIFSGTGFILANAPEASVRGFEVDASISPTRGLTFTAALTYLDTENDNFPNSSVGDLSGRSFAGVSPYNLSLGATYLIDLGGDNTLTLNGDYQHESNVQIADGLPAFNNFTLADPFAPAQAAAVPFRREVNQINAAATLRLNNGLEIGIWGRNLTDAQFISTIFDGVAQAGTVSGYPNQPRTYGGVVRIKF